MTPRSGISVSFADAPAPVRRCAEQAAHLYDTPEWFRVETASGTRPLLAWAASEAGGVAYATLCTSHASDPAWPYARADLFLREMAVTEAPASGMLPSVLVGGRRPGHSSIVVNAAGADREAIVERLMNTVRDHAVSEGYSSLLLSFVDESVATDLARGAGLPSLRFPSAPSWSLRLPGNSFDDWFGSLGRKVRFNEKATMRKLADFGFEWRELRETDIDWIVPLELAQYRKHGHDYGSVAARRLHEAYLAVLGDRAWIAFAVDGRGQRAGFVSLIRHGERAWARQVGLGDEHAGVPLYFGLVYHAVIRWAYQTGVRELDFSVTADEVKRKRGASPRPSVALAIPVVPSRLTVSPGFQPVFA
ncbi:hypothetical protein FHU38_004622 [Saccharomonospora amisosensis]|uniref:BioF2-like acetyltransferase domain-containing protein n=1 Tax=Saccharomonospora amisosensis TaxID=1128677 RepID=A0A7X5UV50_9PSEU|nr:GNAT family N-acetyltransferase [Saccharomonospora amisosensis]NIJ14278.1 hypothetical protein [Saccharomonospora amisosensis]